MSLKGIDVSEFQGKVNWEAVKAAGYQFAMLRAGYGFGTVDKEFYRNAAECNRIGLPVGAYWFCYAVSPETARQEADGCIRTVSDYRLDYPICYDIEGASVDYAAKKGVTVTKELSTEFVQNFCTRIEEYGYFAMFYCNRYFLNNYIADGLGKRFAHWYAYYNSAFDDTDCGIWQYTNRGCVPGIRGNVDLDTSFYDYQYIIKNAGLNHLGGVCPDTRRVFTYLIKPGDTLSEIALRYNTTVGELQRINHIKNPDLIYAGNTLQIPL